MKRFGFVFIVALALWGATVGGAAAADAQSPPQVFAEDVKTMLDRSVGRVVTLHLVSGQEFTGTVMHVGERAVQLSRLAGRDFYDVVVMLDQVDAVLFKVWGK